MLLEDGRANPRVFLLEAVETDRADLVRLLLDDPRVDTNIGVRRFDSILSYAVANSKNAALKELLQDGRLDPSPNGGRDLLLSAVDNKNEEAVRLLLKDGRADPLYNDREVYLTAVDYNYYDIMDRFEEDGRRLIMR